MVILNFYKEENRSIALAILRFYEEVETLKKYLELWSPMNFVTQRDLERLVENKLKHPEQKIKLPRKEEKHSPFN